MRKDKQQQPLRRDLTVRALRGGVEEGRGGRWRSAGRYCRREGPRRRCRQSWPWRYRRRHTNEIARTVLLSSFLFF
jgi:hypothetical protein